MNPLLLVIAMTEAIQTHTPSATVTGDIVTVSADFAWIDPAVGTTVATKSQHSDIQMIVCYRSERRLCWTW